MDSQKTGTIKLSHVYSALGDCFKTYPVILVPFLIFTLIDLCGLIFVFLIPRAPLYALLGPIVRTFWGEQFLHYPANFLLLPKLASLSRTILSVIFSMLLS